MDKRIDISVTDGVAEVTFTRPEKLNALDLAQFEAIVDAIEALSEVDELRCVVLSGEGRAFCAGIDLALLEDGKALGNLRERTHGDSNLFQQAAWGWRKLPVPVIAAVHGVAFGGGCQIMMGADIRIGTPDVRLSLMEMRWGLVPDVAGMVLLRGLVRDDVAREIVFTGRVIEGNEALQIGLLTRLAEDPLTAARDLARSIAEASGEALIAAKRLLNAVHVVPAADLLLRESLEQQLLLSSYNHQEAVRAGKEKRAPQYRR